MINKYYEGNVPEYNGTPNDVDGEFEKAGENVISEFEEKMNEYEISNALQTIWTYIARTNKYIDETAPWSLAKVVEGESEDEKKVKQEKLKSAMYHLVASKRDSYINTSIFK